MTIKNFIVSAEFKNGVERLEKLKEYNAPAIIIDGQQKFVEDLKQEKLSVSGDVECLDVEYVDHEVKKGRGGKVYISFNQNSINYFPEARFGRCIFHAQRETN